MPRGQSERPLAVQRVESAGSAVETLFGLANSGESTHSITDWVAVFKSKPQSTPTSQLDQLELQRLNEPRLDLASPGLPARPTTANVRSGTQSQSGPASASQLVSQLVSLADNPFQGRMKFSHSLLFNSVPEWASYYIK